MANNEIRISKRFKIGLKKKQKFWRESGASEEVIDFLKASYLEEYRKGRVYREHHKISLEASASKYGDSYSIDDSPLLRHIFLYLFTRDSTGIDDEWKSGEYDWLYEVDCEGLSKAAKRLSEDEKKLLNMKFKYDIKQGDIARMLGVTDGTVSKHLAKIINKLRGAMLGGEDM